MDNELGGLEGGTNLLVAGSTNSGKHSFVRTVVTEGLRNGEGTVYVTTERSAEEIIGEYDEYDLDRFGVVDSVTESQSAGEAYSTETVRLTGSPGDMTGIGIEASNLLDRFWEERGIENNRVCLDSVSTLLMYSDLQTVFRFLHVFTGRVRSIDGLGVFIIDPEMHDKKEYTTVRQLFDGVVEVEEDDDGVRARIDGLSDDTTDWSRLE